MQSGNIIDIVMLVTLLCSPTNDNTKNTITFTQYIGFSKTTYSSNDLRKKTLFDLVAMVNDSKIMYIIEEKFVSNV